MHRTLKRAIRSLPLSSKIIIKIEVFPNQESDNGLSVEGVSEMRERFRQWQSKSKINQRWMIGALSTSVFLCMVWWLWLLPSRKLQPDYSRLSPRERATLTSQHRKSLITNVGMVVAAAGGIFVLLNFRAVNKNAETVDFSSIDLSGTNLGGVNLSGADLSGVNLSGADLSGADLSSADLKYADLSGADLSGANINCAGLRYANLSGADLRHTNLSGADLRHANLSDANLNCTLLRYANLSDANLSGALLFFVNSREVQNLEPLQLEAKPSPFICNAALPSYSSRLDVNPNRDCDRIPQILCDRYDISLEEAQEIVYEARQHPWSRPK